MIFLEILLACVLLGWLALGALTFWNMRGATVLEPGQAAELFPQAPGISILVPARNEEGLWLRRSNHFSGSTTPTMT